MANENNGIKGLYKKYFKRMLDIVLSFFALIILSPLLLTIAIIVSVNLGMPVIFKQARPGLNGEIFHLYKFRSMSNKKDNEGNLLPDDVRLTKFGKILRATSLDELPELINILKGDMSIVGPRPLLVQYLPLYNEEQKKRHDVRPGLTGLAQVNGRNAISWEEKFSFDVKYVENICFTQDIIIIIKTIKKVLIREGISSNESVTMDYFKGNEKNKEV